MIDTLVSITSLDISRLPSAIAIINEAFPHQPAWEWAWAALPMSLMPTRVLSVVKLKQLNYWLAVNASGQPVGVSGMYAWRTEPEVAWVGWTVVNPSRRRSGIGSVLLNHVIQTVSTAGYQQLKVYTPQDSVANIVYQKLGFVEYQRLSGTIFYRLDIRN